MIVSRQNVSMVLITIAVGLALGRLMSAQRLYEPNFHREPGLAKDRRPVWPTERPKPMPTFSSNDRSRWATVRALVDEGRYATGIRDKEAILHTAITPLGTTDGLVLLAQLQGGQFYRLSRDRAIFLEDGWQSIDRVLHDKQLLFYSSKPPLLATLIAGLYWILQLLTGWTLEHDPFCVVRTILVFVNILPFGLYLYLFSQLIDRFAKSDWTRLYILGAAGFATLVSPFLITLNNHTLGTFCVLFTLVSLIRIYDERKDAPWQHFVNAGFWSGFLVTNEMPALSFAGLVFLLLLYWAPLKTIYLFVPAGLLPIAGFFLTNYLAVGQLRPAYSEFGGPWYEYEGSHWRRVEGQVRTGIDFAYQHESLPTYAFHVLLGHHGFFSLTPIWWISLLGFFAFRRPEQKSVFGFADEGELPPFLMPVTLLVSVVVIGFYLFNLSSRNYGGFTNGLRWLMWLTPLWLLTMIPAVDRLAESRPGRLLGYGCLAMSILSASYNFWNPWRHPWIYDAMVACGWPGY